MLKNPLNASPSNSFDGTHEDIGHDADPQEAVDQREEVDGGSNLSWPRILLNKILSIFSMAFAVGNLIKPLPS